MAADWWNTVHTPEFADTPIGELLGGLTEIGEQPIPYGRLPRRAQTFYANDFTCWADLHSTTITALISRPKGGISTVRAILTAAYEATAQARSLPAAATTNSAAQAANRLLARLNERDRVLLSTRVWATQPTSTTQVAARLGIHTASVLRNQPRAEARFRELLADQAHHDLTGYAQQLQTTLGPIAREHTVDAALRNLGVSGDAGLLLLHTAGPYTPDGPWLQNVETGALNAAAAILDSALDRAGAVSNTNLTRQLGSIGIPPETATDYLESRPGLRCFGDRWVRWGPSAGDQIEAMLHLCGQPMSVEAIIEKLNTHQHSRTIRSTLTADDRFCRTTRQTWALRQWGLDEYTGIYREITTLIDLNGGSISVANVLTEMTAAFPDVAATSIRTYLHAPGIVIDDGVARRRTPADKWPPLPPLDTADGATYVDPHEFRQAIPVTRDVLRGAGVILHPAVAATLGVRPGQHRRFRAPTGDISVTWRLSSTKGPSVGSLRRAAAAVQASLGDVLILAFDPAAGTVEFEHLHPTPSPDSGGATLPEP